MGRTFKEIVRALLDAHYDGEQAAFAEATGVDPTSLNKWLNKGTRPGQDSVALIKRAHPEVAAEVQAAVEAMPAPKKNRGAKMEAGGGLDVSGMPEAARDDLIAIAALVRRFPSISQGVRRRAQVLARAEAGELDADHG